MSETGSKKHDSAGSHSSSSSDPDAASRTRDRVPVDSVCSAAEWCFCCVSDCRTKGSSPLPAAFGDEAADTLTPVASFTNSVAVVSGGEYDRRGADDDGRFHTGAVDTDRPLDDTAAAAAAATDDDVGGASRIPAEVGGRPTFFGVIT